MSMHVDSRCIECHLLRSLKRAHRLGDEATATAFTRELLQILLESPAELSSAWLNVPTAALFQKYYNVGDDPYRAEKQQSNRFVMERMDTIRDRINGSDDPVLAGIRFAVLGNYIDFSAFYGQVDFGFLDKMLDDALKMELDMDVYRRFCSELEKGRRLLYLTDNAGEIGFDRLCAEAIHSRYPHLEITFCVRGGPAINDATREDAAAVGIPFPVIDSGAPIPGTIPEKLGSEAKAALENADVIFSKGMANVETLSGSGYNIYYAFLIKCQRFMEHFGKPKMTPMLRTEKQY